MQPYWAEITDALAAASVPVRAFTLDVRRAEHQRRIDGDLLEPAAAGWRHERRADYDAARGWLDTVTELIDTSTLSAQQVAARIRSSLDRPAIDPQPTTGR